MSDYLSKPVDPRKLREMLYRQLPFAENANTRGPEIAAAP
jgi:hypothetical protein